MEYLEGMNLDDLVKRFGPLPEARSVYILRQVCGSLAEAHAAGLVHRDVKPANIFLTSRGGLHDFVKVLDFGLVKALDGEENANLTNPHAMTGTPLYVSPEAISQPDRVDARTDVYAVGAVGYYLLTGSPVFTGASVVEICMKHVSATAGSAVGPQIGKPLLARDLERIVAALPGKIARRTVPTDAAVGVGELEHCPMEGRFATARDAPRVVGRSRRIDNSAEVIAAVTVDKARVKEPPSPDTTMMYEADTKRT